VARFWLLRHISRGGFPFPRLARVFRRGRVENHGIGSASCFSRLFVSWWLAPEPGHRVDWMEAGTVRRLRVGFAFGSGARAVSRAPTHHSARTLRRALIFPAAAAAPLVLVTSGAPAREGGRHTSFSRAVRLVGTVLAPARGERRPSRPCTHTWDGHGRASRGSDGYGTGGSGYRPVFRYGARGYVVVRRTGRSVTARLATGSPRQDAAP
jgi:hypothetical protein